MLVKANSKHCVGGCLVESDYSEYIRWYYYGQHAVDDNKNNCEGFLSFEETFTLD